MTKKYGIVMSISASKDASKDATDPSFINYFTSKRPPSILW
jgi:hypothetical protein